MSHNKHQLAKGYFYTFAAHRSGDGQQSLPGMMNRLGYIPAIVLGIFKGTP